MTTIVAGGDVATMNPTRDVLAGGAVVIDGSTIAAVGSTAQLRAAYPDADVVDASGCVVTPGMIDAHQHLTGDGLMRCCIPDLLDSQSAIFQWSVPLHSNHDGDDDEISATLSAVEALTNGVTTVVEAGTVAHPERVVDGMRRAGIRGTIGTWGWDVPDVPWGGTVDEVLDRQRAVVEKFPRRVDGEEPLVHGWVTLVGHDLASDELFAGAADLARALGTSMTMHLSPHQGDPRSYLERTGKRPAVHLHDLGVLGEHLLLGHGVWLDDTEIDLVLGTRTAIAYCPWAYLRLAQGVAANGRHFEMYDQGGRIALGCDAVNAGDTIDILRTAALAAGLARDRTLDGQRFGAHQAFELATIAGAAAIGMDDRIGSLEVGKQADLVIHRTDLPAWTPRGDIAQTLVWGTDGRSVRDVFVAGQQVIADGRHTRIDHTELAALAAERQAALLAKAEITLPQRWPVIDAR